MLIDSSALQSSSISISIGMIQAITNQQIGLKLVQECSIDRQRGLWMWGGNAFTTARELSGRVMKVSTGTALSQAGNDALIGELFSSTILLCDILAD